MKFLLALSGVVAVASATNLFVEPEIAAAEIVDFPTVPDFSPINPDTVIQQRWVEFDWEAFSLRDTAPITLNLFDGVDAKVTTDYLEMDDNGIWNWRATLVGREDTPYSSQLVVSMIPGGQLDGHATIGLRSFTFHSGSVYTRITETDQSKYPNEIDPVFEIPEAEGAKISMNGTFMNPFNNADDRQQNTISVLVLQPQPSQQACNNYQSQLPRIQTLYQNHMTSTWQNQYGVGARVIAACVVYTSNGNFNSDLSFIRSSNAVAQMRNQYSADLVTMMITGGNACGIGYLPSLPVSSSDVNLAFTVCRADCAIDNWTLVHELGHNMGLQHDRYVVNARPGLCNFGGHAPSENSPTTRSIMAYADRCSSLGRNCRRLGSYTDGRQTSGGLGRPCGSTTGETNLNYWRDAVPVVSRYR